MARGDRTEDDDPGALLFGDDDDEDADTARHPQRNLWDEAEEPDRLAAPQAGPAAHGAERAAPPLDDLRYQGPISMDDVDDEVAADSETGPGGGRVFLTAALIGGVIVTLFAAALYFRSGTEATIQAAQRRPARPEPAPVSRPTTPTPAPETGYRPLPDARTAERAPASGADVAPPVDVAITRPREIPSAASQVGTTAPPVAASAVEADDSSLHALARRGRDRLRAAPAGSFTIQVLVACQAATVEKAYRSVANEQLVATPVELQGQSCFRLTWGLFPDRGAADAAIAQVPDYFRESRPRPVAVASLVNP